MRLLTCVAAGLLAAAATATPAAADVTPADPARPVRTCTTTVTSQRQGATVLRTAVRTCTGGVVCTRVERLLPNGAIRLVSDTCPANPKRR